MAMAKRLGRAAAKGGVRTRADIFGFNTDGLLIGGLKDLGKGKRDAPRGRLVVIGQEAKLEAELAALDLGWADWQKERFLKKRGEAMLVPTADGPLWLAAPQARPSGNSQHDGLFDVSPYAAARDLVAPVTTQLADHGVSELSVELRGADAEEQLGTLVGLELGAYRFRQLRQPGPTPPRPAVTLSGVDDGVEDEALALATATNLARHLVNLPPADLNPRSYGETATSLFAGSATMSVEVWDLKRLQKERMGLLIGVGQGASEPPCLIHLRYRPKGKTRIKQPLAFVGKGITFDTGGLDIKDAGSMRLMKKDMGGSASVLGLAWWVEAVKLDVACDFYLAVAENAVDKDAFHPSDILLSRAGQTVEIDNTDAEGRLVLADAFDVAISQKGKDAPAALFDLATLTGAMRIALGTRIAGMFASDDGLADLVLRSGQSRGDPMWRMPLYADYMAQLKSTVADVANSGPGRFGGAITAALFLGRFVGNVPWVHVDMYGWTEGGFGGLLEQGGNGQCVQALAQLLQTIEE
jgi:leucyl aminopeptidase